MSTKLHTYKIRCRESGAWTASNRSDIWQTLSGARKAIRQIVANGNGHFGQFEIVKFEMVNPVIMESVKEQNIAKNT